MTSERHLELQLIRAILTMFCAMSLFHVLCYINYQTRAMVNGGLNCLMEANQLQHDTLESLSGRISALEEAGYGGKLIWKITDIGSRIRDAVSGRVKVFLSPDIYTNAQGEFICFTFYYAVGWLNRQATTHWLVKTKAICVIVFSPRNCVVIF